MIKVNLCKNSVLVSYRMAGSQHLRPLMEIEVKESLRLPLNVSAEMVTGLKY